MNVGNAGFSLDIAWSPSLAFSPSDGQPYVAYGDYGHSGKATVMRFDGTNWVNVGTAGFSAENTGDESLAFSPTGQPYVAFIEGDNSQAAVMKFDGTNWVCVGITGFSPAGAGYTSLAFSPSGQPYVAFCVYWNSEKGYVMKFDGTNWMYLGTAGFSAGRADWPSLAFSPSGQPYVAFEDAWNYQAATVMKYDSVFVGISEPQESGFIIYPCPAADLITIESITIATQSHLSIVNLNGQQLITRQITKPKTQIDISNLPSGVYFVRLTNDKTVEVGKFVKR